MVNDDSKKQTVINMPEAYICANMSPSHVSDNPYRCPVCSSQVTSLARLLDRKETA
jgi:hypothetical protein